MKFNKSLSFLLALLLLASAFLPACQSENLNENKTKETETVAETVAETVESATEDDIPDIYKENGGFAPEIEYLPNRLKKEQVDALPLASADMTYEERRQLAIDYFNLQITFQWVPNMDVTDYQMRYADSKKELLMSRFYSGTPYQSIGTGNLYRWLEYYDETTGVMDLERAFAENGGYGEGAATQDEKYDANGNVTYKKYLSFMTLFNQCSVASYWGWGRSVNSANFGWTYDMNVYNGFIPVGLYQYKNMLTLDQFGEKTALNPEEYDISDLLADWNTYNPDKTIHDCYAQLKPADLLVSEGHTMMVRTVKVVRKSDGSVDPEKSKVTVLEQKEAWSSTDRLHGKVYLTQGRANQGYTFKKLLSSKYIPWTFAEYLDPADPQDKAHLDFYESTIVPLNHLAPFYTLFSFTAEELKEMTGPAVEKSKLFTTLSEGADSMTMAEFNSFALASNYPISDVFVTVKDKDGKELKENVFRALNARTREVATSFGNATQKKDESGNRLTLADGIESLATGENTLEITVQLSTGELLTAFSGKLNP